MNKMQRQFENSVEEDLLQGSMMKDTGTMQSNIYLETNAGPLKYLAEVSSGCIVVKLSIYDFSKCLGTDPNQWWRHSSFRSQVVFSSKDCNAITKTRGTKPERFG